MDTYQCEFCGQTYPIDEVEPTSFFGCYCRRCLKLVLFETEQAIQTINERVGEDNAESC